MKRRRNSLATDSFDLLLDTITNTFGGVLLLALLLVLLIKESSQSKSQDANTAASSAQQAQTLTSRIDELTSRKAMLVQSIEMQQRLDQHFGNPDVKRMASELAKLFAEQQQLQDRESQATSQTKTISEKMKEFAAQLDEASQDLSELAAELAKVQGELKQEQDLRTRTMDLPKEELTNKQMAVVILKGNELFLPNGAPKSVGFVLNKEHFDECSALTADIVFASGKAAKTRAGAGLKMTPEILERQLSAFDPDREYVTLVVLPDSFGSFATLRDVCVKLGLEHRILPIQSPPVVEFRGSGPAKAQ